MTYQIKTIGNNIDQVALDEVVEQFAVNQVPENKADAFICRANLFHDYEFSKELLAIGRAGLDLIISRLKNAQAKELLSLMPLVGMLMRSKSWSCQ